MGKKLLDAWEERKNFLKARRLGQWTDKVNRGGQLWSFTLLTHLQWGQSVQLWVLLQSHPAAWVLVKSKQRAAFNQMH